MSCRRAYDLDLPAFLADPRDAAWEEFRAHYPRCSECSSEVAAWTALHAALAQHHPEPSELLRWSDDPESLAPDARAVLARHLEHCPSCRDELRALDRFAAAEPSPTGARAPAAARGEDPAGAEGVAHVVAAARRGGRHADARARNRPGSAPERARSSERRARGAVRRILWHPAFAYAVLALVLLLPTFRTTFERSAGRVTFDDASRRMAEEAPAVPSSVPAFAPPPVALPAPPREQPAADAARDDSPAGREEFRMEQRADPETALADRPDDARVDRTAPRLLRQAPPRAAAPAPAAPNPEQDARAGSADAAHGEPAAPAGGAPASTTLRALGSALEGDTTIRLLPERDGAARTLAIVLPAGLAGAAVIEVRVRDEAGERELRQRVHRVAGTRGEVTLDIPAGLAAPRLVVEVYADGVGPVASGVVTP